MANKAKSKKKMILSISAEDVVALIRGEGVEKRKGGLTFALKTPHFEVNDVDDLEDASESLDAIIEALQEDGEYDEDDLDVEDDDIEDPADYDDEDAEDDDIEDDDDPVM